MAVIETEVEQEQIQETRESRQRAVEIVLRRDQILHVFSRQLQQDLLIDWM